MDADEHGTVLFNLGKILLQLAELLLAVGSPRAAAKKLQHDMFPAEKIDYTNLY